MTPMHGLSDSERKYQSLLLPYSLVHDATAVIHDTQKMTAVKANWLNSFTRFRSLGLEWCLTSSLDLSRYKPDDGDPCAFWFDQL